MVSTYDFVRYGYLPKELPPAFTSKTFADSLGSILGNYSSTSTKSSKCYAYSLPRVGHIRRKLSIPNPRHQLELFNFLSEQWEHLLNHCGGSSISLSVPMQDPDNERAIKYDLKKSIEAFRVKSSTGYRYLMQTDILDYYPRIYTHIIPWALHYKEIAKEKQNPEELLGNKIDLLVRNTQDKQTMGIPIGPDSSFLIAEIIGSAIDMELGDRIDDLEGLRFFDDFYLYFKDMKKAEKAFSELHSIISDFELDLNASKTEIGPLPEKLEERWVGNLSLYNFRNDPKSQNKDLIRYFSQAFEYSKSHPDQEVLKYAISRIAKVKILEENWELYESLLLRAMMVEPSVLTFTASIFYSYFKEKYNLDFDDITSTINEIISYHSSYRHSHEITWALYFSKLLNISLDGETATKISVLDDSIVAIVALDLNSLGLIPDGLNIDKWETIIDSSKELYNENWLLAYEANVKGWLTTPDDFVLADDFFSLLKTNDVEFYDPSIVISEIEFEEAADVIVPSHVSPGELIKMKLKEKKLKELLP